MDVSRVAAQSPGSSPPVPDAAATPPPLEEPPPSNIVISPGGGAKPAAKPAPAPEPRPVATRDVSGPKFLGAMTCSSSMCHGGGSPEDGRNSFVTWKKLDHHMRAAATLATERSARMAQALSLPPASQTRRCTECHAPFQTVPEFRLTEAAKLDEGISCESCHGAAENWIRSHTRRDFTNAHNVQTGLRDLKGLYGRANACVACHQVLPPDILEAGHPPLIFEMDAQTVAEPRHWIEDNKSDYFGPQAWMVGQATALRETSWSLSQQAQPVPVVQDQWRALVWLLQKAADAYGGSMPRLDVPNATDYSAGNVTRAQEVADDMARTASRLEWSRASTRRVLDALAGSHKDFVATGGESAVTQLHRAQRLVLALSRLIAPFQSRNKEGWKTTSDELDKLFKLADARQAFDPSGFATQLQKFESALGSAGGD